MYIFNQKSFTNIFQQKFKKFPVRSVKNEVNQKIESNLKKPLNLKELNGVLYQTNCSIYTASTYIHKYVYVFQALLHIVNSIPINI